MLLLRVSRYTREDLINNRHALFVFGDNFVGKGYGGQAFACRGEPNAVGIITKISPTEFMTDQFFEEKNLKEHYGKVLSRLLDAKLVVYPIDGIGTGLAKLKENSTVAWRCLTSFERLLFGKEAF